MNADELQRIQQPLKDRYREEPAAAIVTLAASAERGSESPTCTVATGRALVEAGLHAASGGDGRLACSGDMLRQELVACANVTLGSVATKHVGRRSGRTGGFTAIRLSFNPTSMASKEVLDKVIETTKRYRVVLQTLVNLPRVDVSWAPTADDDPSGRGGPSAIERTTDADADAPGRVSRPKPCPSDGLIIPSAGSSATTCRLRSTTPRLPTPSASPVAF